MYINHFLLHGYILDAFCYFLLRRNHNPSQLSILGMMIRRKRQLQIKVAKEKLLFQRDTTYYQFNFSILMNLPKETRSVLLKVETLIQGHNQIQIFIA